MGKQKAIESNENLAAYYFHQGTNFYTYKYLGCHMEMTEDNNYAYTFRVWAPNADIIEVVGDFNGWNTGYKMNRITEMGIWEYTHISEKSLEGNKYKYRITSKKGVHLKADPYAVFSESHGSAASIIYEEKHFVWNDSLWRARRMKSVTGKGRRDNKPEFFCAPLNIYEVHLGSFKINKSECSQSSQKFKNYRELADELAVYVKSMGYTHIELMPIMEHPFDESWGYQICGFYSPTSRFGTPEDFKYFVNKLHSVGVGVILDFVGAHFPKDEHGLFEFDGTPLYEYQGADRMEHKIWGTRFFDVARNEVECFLISNALYWIREFHIDGLRVDAVAGMLYLDFDRNGGEWIPNINGENKNLEAIAFFKKLNTAVLSEFPDVIMIAEESGDWHNITKPVSEGGLGFNFKWNMGWANDTFDYVKTDPYFRKYKHNKLTFPMMYSLRENYILPISHDEVVHGKQSLIDKMYGNYNDKFATMRVFLLYFMTHPGKKLTFMGCEYAQFREWDCKGELEWFMLDFEMHKKMQTYTATLNNFYLSERALWEIDFSWEGFSWIYADMADENILAYRRIDKKGNELICILNFAPVEREHFVINSIPGGSYKEVFSSDDTAFGGLGRLNMDVIDTKHMHDGTYSMQLNLPPLTALILKPCAKIKKGKKQIKM